MEFFFLLFFSFSFVAIKKQRKFEMLEKRTETYEKSFMNFPFLLQHEESDGMMKMKNLSILQFKNLTFTEPEIMKLSRVDAMKNSIRAYHAIDKFHIFPFTKAHKSSPLLLNFLIPLFPIRLLVSRLLEIFCIFHLSNWCTDLL